VVHLDEAIRASQFLKRANHKAGSPAAVEAVAIERKINQKTGRNLMDQLTNKIKGILSSISNPFPFCIYVFLFLI
jgi:hypothetical protein